jgi:hypothetical protein
MRSLTCRAQARCPTRAMSADARETCACTSLWSAPPVTYATCCRCCVIQSATLMVRVGKRLVMAYAKTSLRKEKRDLRERMRAMGFDYRQIASEFSRVYGLRPRAAWREAYGISLVEAAEKFNAYCGDTGLDPKGMSGPGHDPDLPVAADEVGVPQPECLPDPHPGLGQQRQQEPVPQVIARSQDGRHLPGTEGPRHPPGRGQPDRPRGDRLALGHVVQEWLVRAAADPPPGDRPAATPTPLRAW